MDDEDDCRDNGPLEDADDEMLNAATYLCSDFCPCDLEDPGELDNEPPGGEFNGKVVKI